MSTPFAVSKLQDIGIAFRRREKRIRIVPPEGKRVHEFQASLVVYATTLPCLQGFDAYEIDAIIRHMSVNA